MGEDVAAWAWSHARTEQAGPARAIHETTAVCVAAIVKRSLQFETHIQEFSGQGVKLRMECGGWPQEINRATDLLVIASQRQGDSMRTMLRWTVPVERGNEAVTDGTMPKTIEWLMKKLKPESAYFFPDGGERSGQMVFDMANPSQIVEIAERLFEALDAAVEFTPVMNRDDLMAVLGKKKS